MGNFPLIRRLGDGDVAACAALSKTVGWRSSEAQWQMLLGVGDAFGAEVEGTLAGTVIVNRFGDELAAVAMMVVGVSYQRQGIGRRLMEAALEHARGAVVFLYATELGQALYASLGFVAGGASRRMTGPAPTSTARTMERARPMRSLDLVAVYALDEEAQGAPRRLLLDALIADVDRASVVEQRGEVVAFGLSSIKDGRRLLSPIVARNAESAQAVAAHLCVASDLPVCLDLDPADEALFSWAERAGLKLEGSTTRMVLHAKPLPGRRELVRALAGRAFG
jgi:GNAT superfamily N-acetyltransferase